MALVIPSSLLKFIPMPFVAGSIVSLVLVAKRAMSAISVPAGPALPLAPKAVFNPHMLFPVAAVTVGTMCLYYAFLFGQAMVGFIAHEELSDKASKDGAKMSLYDAKFSGKFQYLRTADRSVGNFMEHLPTFLTSLWAYAMFVDATHAATLGWAWVFCRSYYPAVYQLNSKTGFFPVMFASTLPGYLICMYMLAKVVLVVTA